jgi:16S rRNA (cytosine1402-N4)-methyltransferase
VEIIEQAMPVKEKHKHPATRSFQAIRMYINQELQSIEAGLEAMLSALRPGGRLAVISFHSIEDRMVKRFMKAKVSRPSIPAGLPVFDTDYDVPFKLAGKPKAADEQEVALNPRSRSARLRVLERIS